MSWIGRCGIGDCRDLMRQIIAEGVRVQTCVTSPPYWGLRDYGVEGVRYSGYLMRQIGAAPVGRLIRIVARQDGVLTLRVVVDKSREDEEHEREQARTG